MVLLPYIVTCLNQKIHRMSNLENKKVLIVGGAGFVGSNLTKMILNQHKTRKRESPHNNHIDIEDFHKTCEKHDPLGIPFDCGSLRKFNYKNASKQCEDNSLSENSCDKICCKPIQESFNMR